MLRFENDKANALVKSVASMTFLNEREIQITIKERHLLALDHFDETEQINLVSVLKVEEEENWRQLLIKYIQYGILPTDPKKRANVKRRALRFTFKNYTLYILNEVHARVCGAHQASLKLVDQIKRLGYYWPTIV